eukprot:7841117-Pyramimonas_sp.AAC.1
MSRGGKKPPITGPVLNVGNQKVSNFYSFKLDVLCSWATRGSRKDRSDVTRSVSPDTRRILTMAAKSE